MVYSCQLYIHVKFGMPMKRDFVWAWQARRSLPDMVHTVYMRLAAPMTTNSSPSVHVATLTLLVWNLLPSSCTKESIFTPLGHRGDQLLHVTVLANLTRWKCFEQQFYPSVKHLLITGPVVLFWWAFLPYEHQPQQLRKHALWGFISFAYPSIPLTSCSP